jgi:hypothetical protein
MSTLLQVAQKYTSNGLSVIPCKQKRPVIGSWSQYQEAPPTADELEKMFAKGADQIAVICGKVSGNLEVIDIDLKNDDTGELWDNLIRDIADYFREAIPLVMVNTPSGGAHLYYRCAVIEGNQKLASKKKDGRPVVLIETRGEGGYVIAPPSAGYESRTDLSVIAEITPDQRADILDICRKYNQIYKSERAKVSNVQAAAYKDTPWDAYNADTNDPWQKVLEDAGWRITYNKEGRVYFSKDGSDSKNKANWSEEKRLFYVFSTSTEFDSEKAYTPFAIYAVLRCAGDFSLATRELRAAGYGKPFTAHEEDLITKAACHLDKGLDPFDIIRMLTPEFFDKFPDIKDLPREDREKKTNEALDTIINAATERHAQSKGLFWKVGKKGIVTIYDLGLRNFLHENGFRLFVQERGSLLYRLVRVDKISHIIEEIPSDMMKKWVENWIVDNIDDYEVNGDELLQSLIKFKGWPDVIEFITRISLADVSFLRDTRKASFIPFRNGIVHITKDDINILQYHDLPDKILLWANQIKDTDIDLVSLENELQLMQTPVYRFIKRIAGITPDLEFLPLADLRVNHPDKYERFLAFMSTGGYLLSNYKDPGRPYAVGLLEDTASDKDGGGVGKDLYMKILGKIRSVCSFPGKQWKANKDFAFQTYKLGDDILYISDIDRFFNFEIMNNVITEGVTIEKKNKDAFTIPYELSPKIAFSSNYDVDTSAEHTGRRLKKLLFAKYYNAQRRPEDELGGMFWGPDWTHTDWMMFYLVPFYMIQAYLSLGVSNFSTTENMKEKGVKLKYSDEFFDFMQSMERGKWMAKKELFEQFLYDSGYESKGQNGYSIRKFTNGMDHYAKTYGLTFEARREKKRDEAARDIIFCILVPECHKVPELGHDVPF